MLKRTTLAAAALLGLLASTQAMAEPKTLTIDNCAKVEMEAVKGERTTMTVQCTGEANDPKVRDASTWGLTHVSPCFTGYCTTGYCITGTGDYKPC